MVVDISSFLEGITSEKSSFRFADEFWREKAFQNVNPTEKDAPIIFLKAIQNERSKQLRLLNNSQLRGKSRRSLEPNPVIDSV